MSHKRSGSAVAMVAILSLPAAALMPGALAALDALESEIANIVEPEPQPLTRCSTGQTVCVTAIAVPTVVCSIINLPFGQRELQCTGTGGMGGDGRSNVKMPGDVSYSGTAYASGGCYAGVNYGESGSWSGVLGPSGALPNENIHLCTASVFDGFGTQCVSLSVSVRTTANARSHVAGVTIESVSESTGWIARSASICD